MIEKSGTVAKPYLQQLDEAIQKIEDLQMEPQKGKFSDEIQKLIPFLKSCYTFSKKFSPEKDLKGKQKASEELINFLDWFGNLRQEHKDDKTVQEKVGAVLIAFLGIVQGEIDHLDRYLEKEDRAKKRVTKSHEGSGL